MGTLSTKIDFAVIVTVKRANPNGDPLSGNRPRVDYDGYGEISDVCIKRKIRNRLLQRYSELPDSEKSGQGIFVQSDDNRVDEYRSLKERAENELKDVYRNLFKKSSQKKTKDEKQKPEDDKGDTIFRREACKRWIDVRAFGQVFAFGASKKSAKAEDTGDEANTDDSENQNEKSAKGKDKGVSIGIRGPVSVHPAFSVAVVNDRLESPPITKSVNLEKPGPEKASDTMGGMKHRVYHGVYVFYGSMNPQLAALPSGTGLSDNDAEAIKEALRTLFVNDESSARPAGSMEVHKVYWWEHNHKNGQYSSAKVHRSVEKKVRVKDGIAEPKSIDDYHIPTKQEIEKELPGLECEVIDGEWSK